MVVAAAQPLTLRPNRSRSVRISSSAGGGFFLALAVLPRVMIRQRSVAGEMNADDATEHEILHLASPAGRWTSRPH